jgi:hypothetical protein
LLVDALSTVMSELRTTAMMRDASAFEMLLQGGRGTGGLYAIGRRMRALFTGKPIVLDHTERDTGGTDKSVGE